MKMKRAAEPGPGRSMGGTSGEASVALGSTTSRCAGVGRKRLGDTSGSTWTSF
jgi:hypothetical protein